MPAAYKNAGYVLATLEVLISAIVVTHAAYILVKTAQEACVLARKPSMTYSELCEAAFTYGPQKVQRWAHCMKLTVDICLVITYVGVLIVYVVFIAASMRRAIEVYYPDLGFSMHLYCIFPLIPLMFIVQIRNLKFLMPVNILANTSIILVVVFTLYYIFSHIEEVSMSARESFASPEKWPISISEILFGMIAIGIIMPIENEMAKPEKFLSCPGVLFISMPIVGALYAFFGFCGYLKYGDDLIGSITLNLPVEEPLAQCANILMAFAIFLSYATIFYISMEVINRKLVQKRWATHKYKNIIQIGVRCCIVTITVLIAAIVPSLELIISLVGALFFSILGIFLPALVQTLFEWERNLGQFRYILWKNIFMGLFALLALISGSYTSIKGMVETFYD